MNVYFYCFLLSAIIFFFLFLLSLDDFVISNMQILHFIVPIYYDITAYAVLPNTILLSIDTDDQADNSILPSMNNSNTFYTKGLLSTVLYPSYVNSSSSIVQNNTSNSTSETVLYFNNIPKLISGTWSLNVSEGSVVSFNANFKLLSINGIEKHFVELLNFQKDVDQSIVFKPFSTTIIDGFADIKIDDELLTSKMPIKIQISKINTITLTILDKNIDDIFLDRDILGITDSFKNFRGDELLVFEDI